VSVVPFPPTYRGRPPVRIAVVGLGYWGPNLARNVLESPGAELVALCDRSMSSLTRVAPRFPNVPLITDFSEILESPQIEAVVIATPVSSHYRLATASLAAGKHVFVEKPMAASLEEAEGLKDLADRLDLTIMPGHTFTRATATRGRWSVTVKLRMSEAASALTCVCARSAAGVRSEMCSDLSAAAATLGVWASDAAVWRYRACASAAAWPAPPVSCCVGLR
jgi:Oxidoreductase family, NAD-binding Rossmann fold